MEISIIIQSILVISLMVIIGAVVSRTFPLNGDTRSMLISLIVNVGMPCIILSSIFKVDIDEKMFKTILIVLVISVLINLLGISLGWLFASIFYKGSDNIRELSLLSGLGNTGFIGIPLCAVLFGAEGALYAAIFDAGVDITVWTIGVVMLQKKVKIFSWNTFRQIINIPVIAIVLGMTISYFQLKPPFIIESLVDQLAGIAAPLAMFYIGILIMTLKGGKVKNSRTVWLPLTVKLILLPLLVALAVSLSVSFWRIGLSGDHCSIHDADIDAGIRPFCKVFCG